ncbi:ABC transporter permease [Bacteroidia bacterium]|nr:ABC transporter permease [Bacteroidia bacterium]
MLQQYFKQAWLLLRENPLLSIISIAGTALAITLIMVLVITYEVRTANYKPEMNRDRMLYVKYGRYESPNNISNSANSFEVVKQCFYPLKHAEAVTAVAPYIEVLISIPGGEKEYKSDVSFTDADFWKVFDFEFVSGKPYTSEEVESGIPKAVINETLAQNLYSDTDPVGKTLLVNFVECTVAAVVKPVSTLAEAAYAEVWLPRTLNTDVPNLWVENTLGGYRCFILAPVKADIPAIQEEAEQLVQQFNTSMMEKGKYVLNGQPDTHFVQMIHTIGSQRPDVNGAILRYGAIILILLLVPAINLSGMTFSRMNKRMAEMGVRKAFGATKGNLLSQVLSENLVWTLIGGVFGVALSYLAITLMSKWLLETQTSRFLDGEAFINAGMIVHPMVFVYAFLFCLVLNLLSAGIPAWRVSREHIVDALNS